MKKRSIICFVCLFSFFAQAQYFKKGTLSVSPGYCFLSAASSKMKDKDLVTSPLKGSEYNPIAVGPIFLSVNYGLSNSLSVGGTAGILLATSHTGTGVDSSAGPGTPANPTFYGNYYYAFRGIYTIATGRADWHWLSSEDGEQYSMDLYSGASLGIYAAKISLIPGSGATLTGVTTNRRLDIPKAGIAWHINLIGYKQKIGKGDRLCAYGEVGYGCWGIFKIALSYNVVK